MELPKAFNRDQDITVVRVTHEPNMAAYAKRMGPGLMSGAEAFNVADAEALTREVADLVGGCTGSVKRYNGNLRQ